MTWDPNRTPNPLWKCAGLFYKQTQINDLANLSQNALLPIILNEFIKVFLIKKSERFILKLFRN